jgi:hypothetical protein
VKTLVWMVTGVLAANVEQAGRPSVQELLQE